MTQKQYEDELHRLEIENQTILRRCLADAYDMERGANNINSELYKQSEALDRIYDKNNDIGQSLDRSDKTSKKMTNFWYWMKEAVKDKVVGKDQPKPKEKLQKTKEKTNSVSEAESKSHARQKIQYQKMESHFDEQLSKEDQILDELINQVKNVKGLTKQTGREIDNQTGKLNKINSKMDDNIHKMNKIDSRLKKKFF